MDISKIKVQVGQHWVDSNSNKEFVVTKISGDTVDFVMNGSTGYATLTKDGCPYGWNLSGNWKLKIALGQTWYLKSSVSDLEFTIFSIDWAGTVYGTLTDNLTKQITPQHKFYFTLPGIMAELWEYKNETDVVVAELWEPVKAVVIEGLNCDRCNDYCTMVESNRPDGKFRCYRCRH